MISSAITADPGLGSVSDGRCHAGSNALLSGFRDDIFSSCSVCASPFAHIYSSFQVSLILFVLLTIPIPLLFVSCILLIPIVCPI